MNLAGQIDLPLPDMTIPAQSSVERFSTAEGGIIFRINLEAFPGFWAYAYLVLVDEFRVLIDCGSGFGESNLGLDQGLDQISSALGRSFGYEDLTHIVITHAHIDHYGGLSYLAPRTPALIGIHELDRRVLTGHAEYYAIATRRLETYLGGAGVLADAAGRMVEMFNLPKSMFSSSRVDFSLEAVGMRLGPFVFFHVPGHSPGQTVVRLHDVLFSGDHVLAGITPHQSPERLNLNGGLSHYLFSLAAVAAWAGDVRICLGGHNAPITDLPARVATILAEHEARIKRVSDYLFTPHSIADVSEDLFGEVSGYNELLAIEEAGAHVEYLYQRGALEIVNLDEVMVEPHPVPVIYRRLG